MVANAFRLLVECCRQCFAGSDPERLAESSQDVDWPHFLALARRHRVQALAASAIGQHAPAGLTDALREDAREIARDGLASAIECVRIRDGFAASAIPLLFLKGLTVGHLAYGNAFVKMGWDIDLLVAPRDVVCAAGLLRSLGYGVTTPASPDPIARWHRRNKESVWLHTDGVHVVELHSRLADNPQVIRGITVESPNRTVQVASGVSLETLARDELFAYLAVHGGSSNWFRLKWISDFAGVIRDCDPATLLGLVDKARALGAGRAPVQALLLCQMLFGTSIDGLVYDPVDRLLATSALAELRNPNEPTERRFGTVRMHLSHLFLGSGMAYPARELGRKIIEQVGRRLG